MRLSARSSSMAPVTTRRRSRRRFQRWARASSRQAFGSLRKGAQMHALLAASPWAGARQASSAVKQRIGASQAVRQEKQLVAAPCGRRAGAARRAGRNRAHPCGCRNRRRERSTAQKLCSSVKSCGSRSRRRRARTLASSSARRCRTQRSSSGICAARRAAPSRVEAVERAQQIAQGVAQAAIVLGMELQDLGADPLILGIVEPTDPQAQDVGAVLLHHLLGRHHIAEGLRHLAALLVEREAVGQHRLVGRAAAGAAAFQQRGMEPAAMLVRAFEIERRPARPGPDCRLQHEGMGRARFEPDVDDVLHLLVVVGIVVVAEEARGRAREPGVGALLLEGRRRCGRSPSGRAAARRSSC